jgi:hypothetical protein
MPFLECVAFVARDGSEVGIASNFIVENISEVRTALAITKNWNIL